MDVIPCNGKGECIAEFEDQNFSRDSVYYVRAIQEPTQRLMDHLYQKEEFKLCKGSFRTDLNDNCLSPQMREHGHHQSILISPK